MTYATRFVPETLTRAEVDATAGALVLEFGTDWCGWCRGAQPAIAAAFEQSGAGVAHVKVEDGPGRPLGRSFRVKWRAWCGRTKRRTLPRPWSRPQAPDQTPGAPAYCASGCSPITTVRARTRENTPAGTSTGIDLTCLSVCESKIASWPPGAPWLRSPR